MQAFGSGRAPGSDEGAPLSGGPPATAGHNPNLPLSQQSIDKILEANEEGETIEADNSRIEVTDQVEVRIAGWVTSVRRVRQARWRV